MSKTKSDTQDELVPGRVFRDTLFTSRTLILPDGSTLAVTKAHVTATSAWTALFQPPLTGRSTKRRIWLPYSGRIRRLPTGVARMSSMDCRRWSSPDSGLPVRRSIPIIGGYSCTCSRSGWALRSANCSSPQAVTRPLITGKPLSGLDHLRQSIEDILATPVGSRRMRPEYGSQIRRFVDLPVNGGWKSAVQAEVARSLGRWEPRLKLEQVQVVAIVGGRIDFKLTGEYQGESLLLEVSA